MERLKQESVYIGLSLSNPSLRLGELRTFLFTYIVGRKNGLSVFVRIDNTNFENCNVQYLNNILKELNEFGICLNKQELHYWDDDLLYQSKQKDTYKYFLNELKKINVLSENDGLISLDIEKVISMFKNGIKFGGDILRRKTRFEIEKCGYKYIPLYIEKDDRFLFHLPCVVDEYFMNTSIAIRGEDKMPLMPTHDILRNLLGFPCIEYLHLPLILMPDSTKRLKGSQYSLEKLLKNLKKEEILNYLIKSGYNEPLERVLEVKDFIEILDMHKIKKQSSHFNLINLKNNL